MRTPPSWAHRASFSAASKPETFQAQQLADRSRGAWADPRRGETTFSAWAAEWLDSDPRKRPKSRERDAGIIQLHLLPTLGHRPLASVTPLDVQRLVATWSQRLAPATTRRHYAVLRAIFAAAVDSDMIGRSPCRRSVKLPAIGPGNRRIVTAAELHRLADRSGPSRRRWSTWPPCSASGGASALAYG